MDLLLKHFSCKNLPGAWQLRQLGICLLSGKHIFKFRLSSKKTDTYYFFLKNSGTRKSPLSFFIKADTALPWNAFNENEKKGYICKKKRVPRWWWISNIEKGQALSNVTTSVQNPFHSTTLMYFFIYITHGNDKYHRRFKSQKYQFWI